MAIYGDGEFQNKSLKIEEAVQQANLTVCLYVCSVLLPAQLDLEGWLDYQG